MFDESNKKKKMKGEAYMLKKIIITGIIIIGEKL